MREKAGLPTAAGVTGQAGRGLRDAGLEALCWRRCQMKTRNASELVAQGVSMTTVGVRRLLRPWREAVGVTQSFRNGRRHPWVAMGESGPGSFSGAPEQLCRRAHVLGRLRALSVCPVGGETKAVARRGLSDLTQLQAGTLDCHGQDLQDWPGDLAGCRHQDSGEVGRPGPHSLGVTDTGVELSSRTQSVGHCQDSVFFWSLGVSIELTVRPWPTSHQLTTDACGLALACSPRVPPPSTRALWLLPLPGRSPCPHPPGPVARAAGSSAVPHTTPRAPPAAHCSPRGWLRLPPRWGPRRDGAPDPAGAGGAADSFVTCRC